MADTEDVARVLFEWITGEKYSIPDWHCSRLTHQELKDALEELSQEFYIGIESAKRLLWLKQNQ